MVEHDDELLKFEADGAPPFAEERRYTTHSNGAEICFYDLGASERCVILLHGGLGNSRNWGYQVPALLDSGFRVILIDSRGHGRSTRDFQPFRYELMAQDAIAVMDAAKVGRAAFIGWSDGAVTSLAVAAIAPDRVLAVFFFGCNVDSSGTLPFSFTPTIRRCVNRHRKDFLELSGDESAFEQLMQDLLPMQSNQPNYSAVDLASFRVPITVAHAENDEFIRAEHARYLADAIPGAKLVMLAGVSHFAPLQKPQLFNSCLLEFLQSLSSS